MSGVLPGYVVVEGPIGVGKTTLARRLAKTFGNELLLEQPDSNPFIERFYEDPKGAALPTQLFFLFQRARQIQSLRQNDLFKPVRVSDFLIEKDPLFARLNLDDEEYKLYDQVYQNLALDPPKPDLVIYLQAPVDVLIHRVRKRSRSYEGSISADYLHRLSEAYTEFFYHYRKAPLLIVNAADIDLATSEDDYQALLEQIKETNTGCKYFNPLPFAM